MGIAERKEKQKTEMIVMNYDPAKIKAFTHTLNTKDKKELQSLSKQLTQLKFKAT